MNKIKHITAVLVYLCCLLAFNTSAEASRFFIVGVDESGSYDLRNLSMKLMEKLILKIMEPGDSLYGRRITDKSYLDNADTQLLPQVLVIPESAVSTKNFLDLRTKRQAKAEKAQQELVRLQAIKYIRDLKPVKSPKTDIHGFLAACGDLLATMGQAQEKIIIVASDMVDNQHLKSEVDLHGARVIVVAFEKEADPNKTKKTRETWTQALMAMKAGDVRFLGPDQDISQVLSPVGS
ncbi:MAG: hypothetical protein F9K32_13485 [Desulfobulbaceae bacterium]|nr:MAG: hypothetical protein F9K32_13485 [Desulfobulbaceae bacterium]